MLSRERMQERFLELVQIYSPSGGEKEQCRWLMDYFKERGIEEETAVILSPMSRASPVILPSVL